MVKHQLWNLSTWETLKRASQNEFALGVPTIKFKQSKNRKQQNNNDKDDDNNH